MKIMIPAINAHTHKLTYHTVALNNVPAQGQAHSVHSVASLSTFSGDLV